MSSETDSEKSLREQIDRLVAELEQARMVAESANEELTAVTQERDALAIQIAKGRRARERAEAAVENFQKTLVASLATLAARELPDREVERAKYQIAMEELRVLAEELDEANQTLLRANRDLEERVLARTQDLQSANISLEQANRHLAERVAAETAARMAVQSQLVQAQKLEAIGRLTGGIAHDFNNLLTVITSGAQLLAQTATETQRERLVHRIEQAAWRGAELTRRLLAFGRRQPLRPQRIDLAEHADGMRELLRHCVTEQIEVRLDLPDGLWPLEADLAALELAILNLAVNGRDAIRSGGVVLVGARNVGASSDEPARLGLAPGDYVAVFVRDTGSGMTADVLERVFEPFFTTKPSGKGTGLGLAQVYGFAKQSGGTARVESRPGEGTTVSILLPRSKRASQPAPTAPAHTSDLPQHLSVLVVEDDDEVAELVLEMLQQLEHRAHRVNSLPAAIAELSGRNQFDVIFSDVLLGNSGSGLDLAREVARRQLPIPVVLTSGYGGGISGRIATARLPFLSKPYSVDALRAVLSRVTHTEGVRAIE